MVNNIILKKIKQIVPLTLKSKMIECQDKGSSSALDEVVPQNPFLINFIQQRQKKEELKTFQKYRWNQDEKKAFILYWILLISRNPGRNYNFKKIQKLSHFKNMSNMIRSYVLDSQKSAKKCKSRMNVIRRQMAIDLKRDLVNLDFYTYLSQQASIYEFDLLQLNQNEFKIFHQIVNCLTICELLQQKSYKNAQKTNKKSNSNKISFKNMKSRVNHQYFLNIQIELMAASENKEQFD